MKYIIMLDEKFIDYGKYELESILKSEIIFKKISNKLFIFESEKDISKDYSFIVIEGLIKVVELGKFPPNAIDYTKITNAIEGMIDRQHSFKIEAINADFHNEQSSKDIAVKIGSALESKGYRPDLKHPKLYFYIFFTNLGIYFGVLQSDYAINIDAFRSTEKSKISRAQFKLKEALKYFAIETDEIKTVLDIGAAPGGWTLEMLTRNAKVIAVDNALLSYQFFFQSNKKCVIFSDEKIDIHDKNNNSNNAEILPLSKINDTLNESFDLYHIKQNINNLDINHINNLNKSIDLLMIDMNIEPKESVQQAIKLIKFLKAHAKLIMTIKLFNNENIKKYIKNVNEALNKYYDIIKIKKLPHNRDELTLFAILK
ncbi:MAG: SAM-dependent methyltransferase [Candidatus Marsarchaeota archaeon]|jgi:23S rRNA C2498 (ribose-2'-O)-methylase RlmM|nr:SAM-dependent methyltransferase [Candidatus Marsarchaeota archaeon]